MSFSDAPAPVCADSPGSIEMRIEPVERDLGELTVRRVLPSPGRRTVGAFIFFDHMGPAEFPPGKGIEVRPHPHIGLATVTYLFEGEIMHRDSLGYEQPIRAGAVNLMTAGRGIVHSERAGEDLNTTSRLHGIQSWMALPDEHEETDPAFVHYPAATLPEVDVDGVTVRVIIGSAFGATSPVATLSPMLYLECRLPDGAGIELPGDQEELAIYVVEGNVVAGGDAVDAGVMAVAAGGGPLSLQATSESRVMVIGGAPVGRRHIWWNLVSSSRERIEQAKEDWKAGRFAMVPGDDEFIPLPEK